ncbi:MAG: adenine phosphoribosyltransferase [Planctomycetota bacterium]|nr:MAG: adenine phosphoribosyltransferase [Planctomycetota bacterium]
MKLEDNIRDIPDFPKPGIVFKDITPLLGNAAALARSIELMAADARQLQISKVAGIESRGFIFGTAVAKELGVGFVPIRKPGKLPYKTSSVEYDLEYGSDKIEMHVDAIKPGERVLLVDDLLATGGTMAAAVQLLGQQGAEIAACSVVIELGFLGGRNRLGAAALHTLIRYD